MKTIAELRKEQYDYHRKYYAYIFDKWKWYSYRKFKARLYMNVCPYIVYLLMKTKIKPNTVTVVYALMGIVGGIFLAIPLKLFILVGIIFFSTRSFLDWSDGHYARETNQTSVTGAILDPYGAHVGWVALWIGIGLYLANKSIEGIVYLTPDLTLLTSAIFANIIYLIPVIPAIFAMNLILYARSRLYSDHIAKDRYSYNLQKKSNQNTVSNAVNSDIMTKYPEITKAIRVINKIFEHNARTVDSICFIIFLELLFPIFVSWIVFLIFLVWQIVLFVATFYLVAKGGWAEKELQNKLEQIYKDKL
jgi:phosphatidylglycerophosphate synthase